MNVLYSLAGASGWCVVAKRKKKTGLAVLKTTSPAVVTPLRARRAPQVLNIVVQTELVRMRTEPQFIDLVDALVLDPRADDVFGEDVAA